MPLAFSSKSSRSGFGLTELMISLLILSFFMVCAYKAMSSSIRQMGQNVVQMNVARDVNRFEQRMKTDLSEAGYNLTSPLDTTKLPGIKSADDSKFAIRIDLNEDGVDNGSDDEVSYKFDASQGVLYRIHTD